MHVPSGFLLIARFSCNHAASFPRVRRSMEERSRFMTILPFTASKRKDNVLQNIRIASPCPASWEQMAGDERVRHCSECKLNVYNLSAMTRVEAEELLQRREGRLCVRYYRRKDGTILTQDCPRGLRAAAQTDSKNSAKQTQSDTQETVLSVTVVDGITGNPIPNARVTLQNKSGKKIHGRTNASGVLKLSGLASGEYSFEVQHRGYDAGLKTVMLQAHQTSHVTAKMGNSQYMVEVGDLQADAGLLNTSDGSLQTTLDSHAIENIP